jgi:RNA polymerase sigma-70 factor (ECF subfamily)
VQDAFLSASRHFANFEGRAAATTWLTRIVINAALMMRRKRKNTFIRALHDLDRNEADYLEIIPDFHPNPEMASSRAESVALLDGLINEMNPLLRQAVKSAYYDELSSSEASSALEIQERITVTATSLLEMASLPSSSCGVHSRTKHVVRTGSFRTE